MIESADREIIARNKEVAALRHQLRAVQQLLEAEGEPSPTDEFLEPRLDSGEAHKEDGHSEISLASFAQWGPKARSIYKAAAEVIREAGVPLHYRVLAEEVQKRVALGGVDAGATLIAHLHRAQDVFPRVGRGIYGLQGMLPPTQPKEPAAATAVARRRKTRRRTR